MKSLETTRQLYRQQWQLTRKINPNFSITELKKNNNSAYRWLYSNDRQWLNNHKPPRNSRNKNWETEDERLLNLAEKAVVLILSHPNPIWLTRASILREMRLKRSYSLHKLPRTEKYIESTIESYESCLLRRIKMVSQQYIEEETIPTISELYKRANIKKYNWEHRIGDQVDRILSKIPEIIYESHT